MISPNFNIRPVKDVFKEVLPKCYDMLSIDYDDQIIERNAENLWSEYGNDIMEWMEGFFGIFYWDEEYSVAMTVMENYIAMLESQNKIGNHIEISVEDWWAELIQEAMMANAENLFDAEGPLNFYGEPLFDKEEN